MARLDFLPFECSNTMLLVNVTCNLIVCTRDKFFWRNLDQPFPRGARNCAFRKPDSHAFCIGRAFKELRYLCRAIGPADIGFLGVLDKIPAMPLCKLRKLDM